MPRYQVTLAPPPEDPDAARTWAEESPRVLSVGDEILADGRWIHLRQAQDQPPEGFDGAFIASSAVPAGGLIVDGEPLDIYREDAKTLLTELANPPEGMHSEEVMNILERMMAGEDAGTELDDPGVDAFVWAADNAIARGVASAPLIRLLAVVNRKRGN